jgi:hypothetical protein
MQTCQPLESLFQGAVSVETGEDYLRPWRLPFAERELFPSPEDAFAIRAGHPAGVRLRFSTDSRTLALRIKPGASESMNERRYDLVRDNALLETVVVPDEADRVVFAELPAGTKTLEVWLPHVQPVLLQALEIDDGASLYPAADRRKRWITYGSSITHCGAAHSPSRTWPALVARKKGLHLTCLGYGGQCHIDSMVARMIRDLPADIITLKLGINVMGSGSLSPRSFKPAVIGTVRIIREKHPQVPLVLVSPGWNPPRESTPNAAEMTLEFMRTEIADAARRLRAAGDLNLYDVSGLEVLGPDLAENLPDELHPDAEGYERMAGNVLKNVFDRFELA